MTKRGPRSGGGHKERWQTIGMSGITDSAELGGYPEGVGEKEEESEMTKL